MLFLVEFGIMLEAIENTQLWCCVYLLNMEYTTGTAVLDLVKLSSIGTALQADTSNTKYVSRSSILLLLHNKLFC